MFERFTESARRAIFFARYEASQYGSPSIETEHLLLGLLREHDSLARWFPNQPHAQGEIRAEIEKQITRREPISTSVEVPLTRESQKALRLAKESADRLAHSRIEPVHLLIGILRLEDSLAARVLIARGLKAPEILEQTAKAGTPLYAAEAYHHRITPKSLPLESLENFLVGLKCVKAEDLVLYFAKNAEFIDATGKRWKREEMSKGYEVLFAPYAKKNATYDLESTFVNTPAVFAASVLWKNALLASMQRAWMHRMSIVLVTGDEDWEIVLAQVTPVQLP